MKKHFINFLKAYNLLDQFEQIVNDTYKEIDFEKFFSVVTNPISYVASIPWRNESYEPEVNWQFYHKQWIKRLNEINGGI